MTARMTSLTRKGRVTIPVEIRRELDLKEGDRVTVERRGDTVLLRRATSVAEHTAGALAAYRREAAPAPAAERAAFEAAVGAEVVGTETA